MLSRMVVSQVKHNSFFLVGLALGLWVALVAVPLDEEAAACPPAATAGPDAAHAAADDDLTPVRETRPLSGGAAPARTLQRPRYYSTELGIRGSLLAGALSSEEALESRALALNRTASRLQPALRLFISARALQASPPRPNVVGFTDTRPMLQPFHALKYLADNYLEEYDFFFLVSDTSFVNARRLNDLVSRLSVSQDIYMGTVADDDSHYCSLEGGILLSNSVLRAVHGELDWCVRNSYSAHHHENLGRCVLHAAHTPCMHTKQGESYVSARVSSPVPLTPDLADAVTVHPLTQAEQFYTVHAYISRVFLERDRADTQRLRAGVRQSGNKYPAGYHPPSWPGGLRADLTKDPQGARSRFDHLRWTLFNLTHAFMPDDHRAVARLTGAHLQAVQLVIDTAVAWARNKWPDTSRVELVEGSWQWEPAVALRYRLLLRLTSTEGGVEGGVGRLRQIEVCRTLGSARLVSAPYVTESARVWVVLPLLASPRVADDAAALLKRYETVCLAKHADTAFVAVIVRYAGDSIEAADRSRRAIQALSSKYHNAQIEITEATLQESVAGATETEVLVRAGRIALEAAFVKMPREALVLLLAPHAEFNDDFLNRVRMNTISGWQWFSPAAFSRYSQYAHPRFVEADGNKPQLNTGRFDIRAEAQTVAAFYRRDYEDALATWKGSNASSAGSILSASPLRCIRAPEPGLVLSPRPPPCSLLSHNNTTDTADSIDTKCLVKLSEQHFSALSLGARHSLAKLLLETQAELPSPAA